MSTRNKDQLLFAVLILVVILVFGYSSIDATLDRNQTETNASLLRIASPAAGYYESYSPSVLDNFNAVVPGREPEKEPYGSWSTTKHISKANSYEMANGRFAHRRADHRRTGQRGPDYPGPDQREFATRNAHFPVAGDRSVKQASHSRTVDAKPKRGRSIVQASSRIAPRSPIPILRSSKELEARAMERVSYGKSLARRGAFFAAREEFQNTLYLVAESYDRRTGNRQYSQRLKAGLDAMDEATDFEKIGSNDSAQFRHAILASHRTKLVAPEDASRYSRNEFIEIYCQFASLQIVQALGRSAAASESLFAYGKILASEPNHDVNKAATNSRISWSLFRASISVNPENHGSANELGVVYLKSGQLEKAKDMFVRAIKVANDAVYWENLAEVHRRMANFSRSSHQQKSQMILANQALQEARSVSVATSPQQSENWVSAQQFYDDAAIPDSQIGMEPQSASIATERLRNGQRQKEQGLIKKIKKWF